MEEDQIQAMITSLFKKHGGSLTIGDGVDALRVNGLAKNYQHLNLDQVMGMLQMWRIYPLKVGKNVKTVKVNNAAVRKRKKDKQREILFNACESSKDQKKDQ